MSNLKKIKKRFSKFKEVEKLRIKIFLLDQLREFIDGEFKTQVCNMLVICLNDLNHQIKEIKAHKNDKS